MFTPARNSDVQYGFDLPEIFVQNPAQIGKALVIDWEKESSTGWGFNLNPVVGRGGVCGFWGAGQGATTRNGHSIPRSCNAAMCRKKMHNPPRSELTIKVKVKCRKKSLWIIAIN